MDGRKNNGGARPGAGRKKGSGMSGIIKNHVDNFMLELLKEDQVKQTALSEYIQLEIDEGWIYVIRDDNTSFIKIGVTQKKNPSQRLNLYKSHNMEISLLFLDKVKHCFDIEGDIHAQIEAHRKKGDWFDLDVNDVMDVIFLINKHNHKKYYDGRW
jgi:hypothetical protein